MSVIEYLEKELSEMFGLQHVTIEAAGRYLCGENYCLARNPFSKEFLENVSYNGPSSMKFILWLQLSHLASK